jgi:adenosylcobinamide-GDP ribazoletransferase
MKVVAHFVLGLQFLTRINLTKKNMPCQQQDFRGAMNYFTLIGLIIGFLQYGVFSLSFALTKEIFLSATLATFAGVFVTGGMHLDGLADLFDGFGAQKDRLATLEIMKDSRVGSFGAIALLLDISLHITAIAALSSRPVWIIAAPMIGKWGVVLLCYAGKCASKGLGALWIQNIGKGGVAFNTLIVIGALFLFSPLQLALLLASIFAFMLYFKKRVTDKLGGVTGDCLGAMQQMIEWLVLVMLVIFL